VKTIQVMPASDAGQYCARETDTLFSDVNKFVQAISIGGGSPRLMKRRAMLMLSRLPRTTTHSDTDDFTLSGRLWIT
jgi:hypothetical protein